MDREIRRNVEIRTLLFDYNLSTNYLPGAKLKSLADFCILNVIVKAFKSEEAIAEFLNPFVNSQEREDNVISIVEDDLVVIFLKNYFMKKVLITIRVVFYEIKNYVTYLREEDLLLFLRNLVFNVQGFINPRKTVLKVLSNKLSNQERFEIACLYLFDEHVIETYFNDLTLEVCDEYLNLGQYLNLGFFDFLPEFFFYYWTGVFTGRFQKPADLQVVGIDEETNSKFFCLYLTSKYATEIGVQYLFETLSPSSTLVPYTILFLFRKFPRINIMTYLICQLRDLQLVKDCGLGFLSAFIETPRWHDHFIRYFSILRELVNRHYYDLIFAVVLNVRGIIRIEGTDGKYFAILRSFMNLIPDMGKRLMLMKDERLYALQIFLLFSCFQEVQLIYPLLYKENDFNVGKSFFQYVQKYFAEFVYAFRCYTYSHIERLLIILTSSEEIIHFREQYFKFNWFNLMNVHNKFRGVARHFMESHLIIFVVAEEIWRKWKFLCIENGEIVNLSLPSSLYAVNRVEYAEQFLALCLRENSLIIYYKNRMAMSIYVN